MYTYIYIYIYIYIHRHINFPLENTLLNRYMPNKLFRRVFLCSAQGSDLALC